MLDIKKFLSGFEASLSVRRPPTSDAVRGAIALAFDLQATTPARRVLMISNFPKYQTIELAAQLLALAADVAGESPADALSLLDTFEVLADLPAFERDESTMRAIADLSGLAQIRRAVTLMKLNRIEDAATIIRLCAYLDLATVEDQGELLEARARLAAIRQQLPQALGALAAAKKLYEGIGDNHLVGRALLAQGFAYGEARRNDLAVTALLDACEKIDASRDRRLALAASINLARALRDSGRSDDALEVVHLTRRFVSAVARKIDRLHVQWLEAGLLADVGQFSRSANAYLDVARAFAEEELVLEVAELALEAVETFSYVDRTAELAPLLAIAVQAFRAQNLEEDHMAAWLLLQNEVARQVVSAAALQRVRVALSLR
ncbi:MAG: hypothetical protein ABI639_14435 [Thermoanaerobaculia bacterium]